MTKISEKTICVVVLVSLLLVVSPALGGAKTLPKSWPKAVTIGSAAVGSSIFAIATGMATLITRNVGVKAVAESGMMGKSLVLIHKGDIDFGMSAADIAYFSARGLEQYKQYGKMKVQLLFSGSTPPSAFITRAESGMKKIEDLKGKIVMVSRPNNWTFTRCGDIILRSAGMTRKDVKDMTFSGSKESREAILERRVDAVIAVFPSVGVSGWIKELNMRVPLRFISGEEKKLEAALSEVTFAKKATFYAKYWGSIVDNKDLVSVGVPHHFLCRPDLPTDFVCEAMKAIFENLKELHTYHPEAKPYTSDPLALTVLPYHPGAVKFYKEKGLWTPQIEEKQQKLLKEVGSGR